MPYLNTDDGYIVSLPTILGETIITEEQYKRVLAISKTRPTAPSGYAYKLRADTLEWKLVELPPMPEPELTDEEALEILLGGAAE